MGYHPPEPPFKTTVGKGVKFVGSLKSDGKAVKIYLMTINAFRRPSKSDKIDPRRDPGTHAIAHSEAGEGID